MNAKSYAEAAEKFEAVVAADPNNDLAWYQLARRSRQAGRCDRAIVAYRRYMDLVPNMPDPYYGLGLCLVKTGDKAGRAGGAQALRRGRAALEREGLHAITPTAVDRGAERAPPAPSPTGPGGRATPRRRSRPPPSPGNAGLRRGAGAARSRPHRRGDREVPAGDRRSTRAIRRRAPRWASCCSRSDATTRRSTVLRADRRQEPHLFARLVRPGVRVARARPARRRRRRLRALHQAQARATRIRTTASAARCSTSVAPPTRGARSRPTCRSRSARASSAGSSPPRAQLRTLTASAK